VSGVWCVWPSISSGSIPWPRSIKEERWFASTPRGDYPPPSWRRPHVIDAWPQPGRPTRTAASQPCKPSLRSLRQTASVVYLGAGASFARRGAVVLSPCPAARRAGARSHRGSTRRCARGREHAAAPAVSARVPCIPVRPSRSARLAHTCRHCWVAGARRPSNAADSRAGCGGVGSRARWRTTASSQERAVCRIDSWVKGCSHTLRNASCTTSSVSTVSASIR